MPKKKDEKPDKPVKSRNTSEKKERKSPAEKSGNKTKKPVSRKTGNKPKKENQRTVATEPKQQGIPVVEAEVVVNEKPKKGGVGGNGNLVPFDQRAEDEQRAIRSKGGKARAEKYKKRKELREFTRDFLFQQAAPVLQNNMKMLGVNTDEMTNLSAMVVRLFSKAVNNGDLNAARTIIEWAGMAPLQQERENEAIAKMSQVMQLASGEAQSEDAGEDVVFYLPSNGRDDVIIIDENPKE